MQSSFEMHNAAGDPAALCQGLLTTIGSTGVAALAFATLVRAGVKRIVLTLD